jgi:hypothetical protein
LQWNYFCESIIMQRRSMTSKKTKLESNRKICSDQKQLTASNIQVFLKKVVPISIPAVSSVSQHRPLNFPLRLHRNRTQCSSSLLFSQYFLFFNCPFNIKRPQNKSATPYHSGLFTSTPVHTHLCLTSLLKMLPSSYHHLSGPQRVFLRSRLH